MKLIALIVFLYYIYKTLKDMNKSNKVVMLNFIVLIVSGIILMG